jgi:hypothetical protein
VPDIGIEDKAPGKRPARHPTSLDRLLDKPALRLYIIPLISTFTATHFAPCFTSTLLGTITSP